ncbi:MATE family efflux transporter [Endozoicomonas sp. (ex Bugula neritina AB1)]|nr:MATE family efflux transporter [Endozoicomonas sp. (ex Bugula neritina AB1)]
MTTTNTTLSRFLHELRELLVLAGPILGAQLAAAGMSFVDTSMAGQYSSVDLAGIALGSSVWIPVFLLTKGMLLAITPTVSHLYGAGKMSDAAAPVRQGLWLALVLSVLTVLLINNAGIVYELLEVTPDVSERAISYMEALSWGIPAVCLYQVLSCYCEGLGQTKPAMVFSFAALLLNIPVNYVLIYGKFGFPELGGVGCGYATAICFWLTFVLMAFYVLLSDKHKKIGVFKTIDRPDLAAIAGLMKLGIPIGLAIFFEVSIFSLVGLLIGQLGAATVAGHQVALNFSSMMFMVPLSLSFGVTIRVGQALGAGKFEEASFSSFSGVATCAFIALFSASIMWFLPEAVTALYTKDPEVIALAVQLLAYAAVFQLSDGVQVAANGALRGYKDTRVPMIMVLIACWGVALPLGYVLGLTDIMVSAMGPEGLWIGLITALSIAAVLFTLRLRTISRRYTM